ncbi:hypothetical protein ACFFUB_00425 [Algimonas porphyrae]|uniref:Uncharacterized protein n=1 Tax=Algimonas porphyrae TaxID=1128113 RepID=A0ABQ5V1I4_9PROT|nr:hypothetical protein [Algimonas porphyrae]GLQ20495.1 hypothetical protein GCM10007854_14500 [Algimonas porphyrae]
MPDNAKVQVGQREVSGELSVFAMDWEPDKWRYKFEAFDELSNPQLGGDYRRVVLTMAGGIYTSQQEALRGASGAGVILIETCEQVSS